MTILSSFTQAIKEHARSLGINLVGIAPAKDDSEGEQHLRTFIEKKHHGDMAWLESYQKRVRPEKLLPGAKSVIVIGVNYYREAPTTLSGHGRIARYAWGRDYHKILKKLLKQLAIFICEQASHYDQPEPHLHFCVDSSPLLERSYAVKAGLGFIGKNTMLITPEFGSFVLLGEIVIDLELEYDRPATGTCGTCTRCIDACPTRAIIQPREIDARRCISYLTIENKGPIPEKFHKAMGNWIFGCDVCQEVCPYNKVFAKPLQLEAFKEVTIAGSSLPLKEILNIKTDEEYVQRFAGSPLMRAKRKGLRRNAEIIMENSKKNIAQKSLEKDS